MVPLLQEYGSAISYCSKALEVEPNNYKALLRRLKARIAWHDYEGAAADLEALRELDPWGVDVAAQAQVGVCACNPAHLGGLWPWHTALPARLGCL
jgi:hypothetical protein